MSKNNMVKTTAIAAVHDGHSYIERRVYMSKETESTNPWDGFIQINGDMYKIHELMKKFRVELYY